MNNKLYKRKELHRNILLRFEIVSINDYLQKIMSWIEFYVGLSLKLLLETIV